MAELHRRQAHPLRVGVLLLAVVVGTTACGAGKPVVTAGSRSSSTSASSASTTLSTSTTSTTDLLGVPDPNARPHFDTPEAAMTYLAAAWNAHDLVSLKHVTDPAARDQLDAMHNEAVNLRLDHCNIQPAGDYECYFDHDYPLLHTPPSGGPGQAEFLVGPADEPGWYMTVFVGCG
jgi:hypothetical protein